VIDTPVVIIKFLFSKLNNNNRGIYHHWDCSIPSSVTFNGGG